MLAPIYGHTFFPFKLVHYKKSNSNTCFEKFNYRNQQRFKLVCFHHFTALSTTLYFKYTRRTIHIRNLQKAGKEIIV